jgi:hypothetical protein
MEWDWWKLPRRWNGWQKNRYEALENNAPTTTTTTTTTTSTTTTINPTLNTSFNHHNINCSNLTSQNCKDVEKQHLHAVVSNVGSNNNNNNNNTNTTNNNSSPSNAILTTRSSTTTDEGAKRK